MFKKSIRTICQVALLIALEIVLNRMLSFNTPIFKIGISCIPIIICGIAFGPAWAAVVAAVADVLGATIFPIGAFIPGFTLSAILKGLIWGLFLYSNEDLKLNSWKTWLRILCPIFINCVLIGLFLDTYWLSQVTSQQTYIGILSSRLIQFAILIPIQIVIVPFGFGLVKLLRKSSLIEE